MNERDLSFRDFLGRHLVYSNLVTDEAKQREMFRDYQLQMRARGIEPVEFDRILFLSSGMSSRDEDADFSPSDVREEARNLWGYLIKNHNSKLDTVVLSIGFDPNLHVEGFLRGKESAIREKVPATGGRNL